MGKINDPFDASSPTLFASVMNNFGEKTTIHLGPGIFQTFGFNPNDQARGWQVKSGQRIFGAGMNATTLKIVGATTGLSSVFAVPISVWLDGLEIADLAIDCNMRGHQGSGVANGAVYVYGRRIRIRRLHVFDFATEGGSVGNLECFVIVCGAWPTLPDSADCIVEDCLIDRPCSNGFYNSSCILVGGGETSDGHQTFLRHGVIRDCLIDCEYKDNPISITSISYSGSTATVLTKTAHGRLAGEWIVITGALVDQVGADNPFNGSFKIDSVIDSQSFTFTLQATASAAPTGEMWIGKRPSHMIGIRPNSSFSDLYNPNEDPITVQADTPAAGQWTVTVRTQKPHLRVPGNNVALWSIRDQFNVSLDAMNRLFGVSEVVNPTKFRFVMPMPAGSFTPNAVQDAGINSSFAALGADNGIAAMVRNNRVFGTWHGHYHDTFATRDLTIQKNVFSSTQIGVANTLRQGEPTAVQGTRIGSITVSGSMATFTANAPHYFTAGEALIVRSGANSLLDGNFEVDSILSATKFTYQVPAGLPAGPTNATAYNLWQVGRIIIERNVIDLILHPLKGTASAAVEGIDLHGAAPLPGVPPYVFRQAVVRQNTVQQIDRIADSLNINKRSMFFEATESAIVERNIFDVCFENGSDIVYAMYHSSDRIELFRNQTAEGGTIQLYNYLATSTVPVQFRNNLLTEADLESVLGL